MTGSKSICLYGATGSGKTAQAGRFVRWIYETTGKITRAVISDLGSSLTVLDPYIRAGIVEPWYIANVSDPTAVLHKLSRGDWPVPSGGLLQFQPPGEETWKRVGAYLIDSGTEIAEAIIVSLRAKGVRLSQDPSFTFEESGEKFYGGNMTYFGFAQDKIVDFIRAFSQLPVEAVLWTMGEGKGEDDVTREAVYGPETVGKALRTTGKLPKKFGDCLHCEVYNVIARDKEGKDAIDPGTGKPLLNKRWRIYFQDHPDPVTGINYPAKPRVPPEMWPRLIEAWPGGFLRPTIRDGEMLDGLDQFLRREADLLAVPVASVAAWKVQVDAGRLPKNAPTNAPAAATPAALSPPPARITNT